MCTKVYEADGQAVTSGCFTESHSGREVKVCVCRTVKGSAYPCNGAKTTFQLSLILKIVLFFACFYAIVY